MLPPLFRLCAFIESQCRIKFLRRIRSRQINSVVMPAVTLSTGVRLLCEDVQQAAYYPRGSLRVDALIHRMSAGRYGAPETHEQNFLCIRTINGSVYVRGSEAGEDATALEQAGIKVYRPPKDC